MKKAAKRQPKSLIYMVGTAELYSNRLRTIENEECLSSFIPHTNTAEHYFCIVCETYLFHRKRVTPDYFGGNMFCLEDCDPKNIPIRATVGEGMK